MKIDINEHIAKPPGDVFRMISDLTYFLESVDPDVVSASKTSTGPIGVGTTFLEVLKVPMSTARVVVEVTAFDPGKSLGLKFDSNTLKGNGTFNFAASGDGTDVNLNVDASTKPVMGWLMYPMIRMDLSKREKSRLANLKRMAESGEMDASKAEGAEAAPAG